MIPLLIVRPEPGASATAARATELGLKPAVRPLFSVGPRAWDVPDADDFDCLVLTSANAARHAGSALGAFAHLPVFAVGEATALATRRAGLCDVRAADGDADALFQMVAAQGFSRPLHLAGRDRTEVPGLPFEVTVRTVYASGPAEAELPPPPYVVLLHSARAAARFGTLVSSRGQIDVVAISLAVAIAAGAGFRSLSVAERPDDASMLALAAELCERRLP